MMLVEEGKIALEDPVSKHIPEFADLKVLVAGVHPSFVTKPCDRPMQVIDLLRHTSGLTYGFQYRSNVDAAYRSVGVEGSLSGMPLEEFIKELGKLPLDFSPGTSWNYSVSTDVLGYLVQVVSGMPFQDFLHKRLIDPLGMKDTSFEVPADKADRLVSCYARGPDNKLILQDDCKKSKYLAAPAFYSGGGGLCSTASDYMIFCQMLLNGGTYNGTRFISRKTLALMTSNHLPGGQDLTVMSRSMFSEATNAGIGFGLGFAVNINPAAAMISSSKGEYYWG
jgi:CubicO group peptidase (beta-lactamase class C family)